jgi:hypothetical protein
MKVKVVIAKKTTNKPATPSVKKIIEVEEKDMLLSVPDDKNIYWVDVKNAYPELEQKLKPLFAGKDRLSVGDLKKLLLEAQKEDKFYLSEDEWRGAQQELDDVYDKPQEVIQLNLGNVLIEEIKKDPTMDSFFIRFSNLMKSSGHPVHSQTVAWARIYKFPDKWIIEEIQSDLFGATPKIRDLANSSVEEILGRYTSEQKKHIENFWIEHFTDWDKKLVATIITMARKDGIKDIWIFDEDIKKENMTSPSKLDRYYKVVPRDLGFKRDKLEVGERNFTAWHRVVANKVV